MMALETELQNLGLSDKEARVYLALLELGQESAQNIAKNAKVNRATTYVILNSLAEKGLVSSFEENRGTQYVANDPQSLAGFLELRKKKIDEQEKHLESILPSLKSRFNRAAGRPTLRFFEGKEGLFEGYREFLTSFQDEKESIKLFFSRDLIEKAIPERERKKFIDERKSYKITTDVIYTYSEGEIPQSPDTERVKISEKEYPISIDLEIHGDNVFISTLNPDDLNAVLIKNKDIAESFKTFFKLAKKGAQSEEKK